jgi:thymidine phosphorylase
VKSGDRVESGEALCLIHASGERAMEEAADLMRGAIELGDAPPARSALIGEIIG